MRTFFLPLCKSFIWWILIMRTKDNIIIPVACSDLKGMIIYVWISTLSKCSEACLIWLDPIWVNRLLWLWPVIKTFIVANRSIPNVVVMDSFGGWVSILTMVWFLVVCNEDDCGILFSRMWICVQSATALGTHGFSTEALALTDFQQKPHASVMHRSFL